MRFFLFFSLLFFSSISMAGGEETYKAVCANCHATGLNKAPLVGDKKQWGKLIKEGQAHITSDGYHGVGAMPPKGGKPDLTVAEFSSAVVYMANQAGANWKEPDELMLKDINQRIAKKLSKS
jgi:mono/diheme cytochrome c family protein